MTNAPAPRGSAWTYPQPYGAKTVLIVIAALALLFVTGQRVEVGKMASLTGSALLARVGIVEDEAPGQGLGNVL